MRAVTSLACTTSFGTAAAAARQAPCDRPTFQRAAENAVHSAMPRSVLSTPTEGPWSISAHRCRQIPSGVYGRRVVRDAQEGARAGGQLRRADRGAGGEARAARRRRRDGGVAERPVPVQAEPDLAAVRQAQTATDITFPVAPTLERARHRVRPRGGDRDRPGREEGHVATTAAASYGYDYLVIATGYRNKFDVVPGLARRTPTRSPRWRTRSTPARRWRRFLDEPGRHRRRGHPGRRLLRRRVRVPVQHRATSCARPA